MAKKQNSLDRFWKELKRRKVVHVITVYAATAFVILELVNNIARPLQLPDWTEAFVIVLLCIGFIVSVVVSWVYDITPAGVRKTKPAREIVHIDQTAHKVSSSWKIATYISGAIIIVLLALNFISRRNLNADISRLEKSIAVLPFINDSGNDSTTYFINGIMERITTNLQMIKEFRVIGRTSVEQYRNNNTKSSSEIAKELGVNYIIEGSGEKYGNSFGLVVQLLKAKGKETHLWAETYKQEIKEVGDYIRIMSEVAEQIATGLKVALNPEEIQLIEKIPTSDLAAHNFYLKGREELLIAWLNNNDNEALGKAEDFSRKAIALDSTFAQAYANLSLIYLIKHRYNVNAYFSDNYLDSTLIFANRSLYHDENLADAYYAKGVYYYYNGNTEQTLKEFDKALNYNKNYWQIYDFRGRALYRYDYQHADYVKAIEDLTTAININRGKELPGLLYELAGIYADAGFYEKALDYYKEALKINEDSISYFIALVGLESDYGNYEKAIDLSKKCLEANSDNISVMKDLGEDYMYLKQFKESMIYFNKAIELLKERDNISITFTQRIAYTYWRNGLKKEAQIFFNEAKMVCEESINMNRMYAKPLLWAYYDIAGILAFNGEKQKAYENLNIFNKIRVMPMWLLTIMKNDPLFDNSIRNEPKFQQIVVEIEAKYQAEHERVRKWLEEQGML